MLIKIDLNKDEPIYKQLMDQIRYGIASGYLKPGEELPSVRQLASDLGINMHTVAKAYNLLKAENILIVNSRKGVKISTDVFKPIQNSIGNNSRSIIEDLVSKCILDGIPKDKFITECEKIYDKINNRRNDND